MRRTGRQRRSGRRSARSSGPRGSTLRAVIEIGIRQRNQPAPPHILFEALTEPDRDPARPWLELLDDEVRPSVIRAEAPSTVVWSSIWLKRPDAILKFDMPSDGGSGTDLRWVLLVDEPPPADALIGHMRKRVNQLINANLRYTFGQ